MTSTTASNNGPFLLANTSTTTLANHVDNYRISIAVPAIEPPAQGFPVMYLLDANAGFATVVETHRRLSRRPDATRVGPAVIVGIGHETDKLYDSNLRQRDFASASGCAEFLDFIQRSVKPLVQQHAAIDPTQQILAGHSLAGLFALWVLRHATETFTHYIALSPSLWSEPSLVDELISTPFQAQQPHVFLAVGEWEQTLAPWQIGEPGSLEIQARRQQRGMVSKVVKLGAVLQQRLGTAQVQCQVFPQEDHASVFAIGMSRAMRMVLASTPTAESQND